MRKQAELPFEEAEIAPDQGQASVVDAVLQGVAVTIEGDDVTVFM